jgi:chorismate mutase / prephenate dehydrogenase
VSGELEKCRAQLDALDADLIRLLARRIELGLEAAEIKRAMGLPIVDPEREASVIAHAREWAREAGLPESDVENVMRQLISLSRQAQMDSR